MDALEHLASLLTYPDDDYPARVRACTAATQHPALEAFARQVGDLPLSALQEAYIDLFDLNSAATLETGWHLFGEQYERGQFLVDMRQRLRAAGIPEMTELPDHLVHVLRLLATLAPRDRAALAVRLVAPALARIRAAVPAASPFAELLRAVAELTAGEPEPALATGGHDD